MQPKAGRESDTVVGMAATIQDSPDGDDEPVFERVPPHDLPAEQATLGGMLLSKDAIAEAVEVVSGRDFYRHAHRIVFEAIATLYVVGEPADPVTVAAKLTKGGDIDRVGGAAYIHTLINSVASAAETGHHAEIVREKAVLRRLIESSGRIIAHSYAARTSEDTDRVIEMAQQEIFKPSMRDEQLPLPLAEAMECTLDEIEAISNRPRTFFGIPTGFRELDLLTNGLRPGQLIVIGARAAVGKSTLALDLARSCSVRNGLTSVLFTLDTTRNETIIRLLSAESRVLLHHVRSGTMSDEDWARIARRMGPVSEAPLFIQDRPNMTFTDIRAVCRRLHARHDLRLAIIDGINDLTYGTRPMDNRYQEIAETARGLKQMAKELGIPVVATSGLNRNPEARTDKRPMLSDLRDSGTLEEQADLVILLHREDAYERESPRAGLADMFVAKHRHGPTAWIEVAFQGHYSRFVDTADNHRNARQETEHDGDDDTLEEPTADASAASRDDQDLEDGSDPTQAPDAGGK
jgi:replicative DNA helicase